ncbi:MAG: hypothetical protein LAT67_13530 [Balneolales bacterium]|nr:hypothetical protein [Balneolales bacterium]
MFESIHKSGLPLFLLGVSLSSVLFFFLNPLMLTEGLTGIFYTLTAVFGVAFTLMMFIPHVTQFPEPVPSDFVFGMLIPTGILIAVLFFSDISEQARLGIMAYGPALGTTFYLAVVLVGRMERDR